MINLVGIKEFILFSGDRRRRIKFWSFLFIPFLKLCRLESKKKKDCQSKFCFVWLTFLLRDSFGNLLTARELSKTVLFFLTNSSWFLLFGRLDIPPSWYVIFLHWSIRFTIKRTRFCFMTSNDVIFSLDLCSLFS